MIWYSLSVSVCAGATVIESPGVHAHRVEVLDRADDDAVVLLVADNLHLEFLPADHRLLDQELSGGRGLEAALADGLELLHVVGDAAAGAAEREGRPDDRGEADHRLDLQRLLERVRERRARALQPDLGHRVLELLAILGLVDRLLLGADHLDAELLQHALAREVERAVQRRLARPWWAAARRGAPSR
jgi:hypothetical protein